MSQCAHSTPSSTNASRKAAAVHAPAARPLPCARTCTDGSHSVIMGIDVGPCTQNGRESWFASSGDGAGRAVFLMSQCRWSSSLRCSGYSGMCHLHSGRRRVCAWPHGGRRDGGGRWATGAHALLVRGGRRGAQRGCQGVGVRPASAARGGASIPEPAISNQQSANSTPRRCQHHMPHCGVGGGAPDASGVLAQGHNTRARERGKVHHGVHAREVALQVGESVREHEPPCRQASTSVLASRVRAIHRLNCTARGFREPCVVQFSLLMPRAMEL